MRTTRHSHILLWVAQSLLALLFLFAGVMKFVMPAEAMAAQSPVPVWFLRFIGTCEVLGAVGLILPELLRIRRELTPLAAAGLVIIMTGATVITAATGQVAPALFPFAVGLLCAYVARGRWRQAHERSTASRYLAPAPARS